MIFFAEHKKILKYSIFLAPMFFLPVFLVNAEEDPTYGGDFGSPSTQFENPYIYVPQGDYDPVTGASGAGGGQVQVSGGTSQSAVDHAANPAGTGSLGGSQTLPPTGWSQGFDPSGASQSLGGSPVSPSGRLGNPLKFNSIQDLIRAILNIIVTVGTPLAVFFFVFAGFLYATARGNETQITKAHQTFLWTAIGTLVLLGAFLLSDVLKGTVEQITGRPL